MLLRDRRASSASGEAWSRYARACLDRRCGSQAQALSLHTRAKGAVGCRLRTGASDPATTKVPLLNLSRLHGDRPALTAAPFNHNSTSTSPVSARIGSYACASSSTDASVADSTQARFATSICARPHQLEMCSAFQSCPQLCTRLWRHTEVSCRDSDRCNRFLRQGPLTRLPHRACMRALMVNLSVGDAVFRSWSKHSFHNQTRTSSPAACRGSSAHHNAFAPPKCRIMLLSSMTMRRRHRHPLPHQGLQPIRAAVSLPAGHLATFCKTRWRLHERQNPGSSTCKNSCSTRYDSLCCYIHATG